MSSKKINIVVVGGGGAGLFAAIEAARLGKNVVVLEKNPKIGGATVWSVGSLSSSCSPFQVKEGIQDTPAAHFEDIALFHGSLLSRDNPRLRRIMVENVPETLRQLIEMGVIFFGPMPEPPHRVPRMHNVLPSAKSYGYHLEKKARSLGVTILTNMRATRLILDDNGAVAGVEAQGKAGNSERFLAENGVVLAAGDFSGDREMKITHANETAGDISPMVPTSTGDGHKLALDIGAVMINGDLMSGPQIRFLAPKRPLIQLIPPYRPIARFMRFALKVLPAWILRPFILMFVTTFLEPQKGLFEAGAIMVNQDGRRFTDETDKPQFTIHKQPEGVAYILLDDALAKKFSEWPNFISTAPGVAYAYLPDYRRNRRDVYAAAPTLEKLAKKLGIPADTLRETVDAYNKTAGPTRAVFKSGPYHALGPVKNWIGVTEGGVEVTDRHEVVREDGSLISGLFAAGGNGQSGIILEGHGHHLGWAFTSGRLAGRHAAYFDRSASFGEDADAASTHQVANTKQA